MRNPAETLAAIGAALDTPSPELAAVPGALAYMRAEHKAVSEMVSGLEERDAAIPRFIHDWIARLAAALGIEVQP